LSSSRFKAMDCNPFSNSTNSPYWTFDKP
jgi:hypothetical protein